MFAIIPVLKVNNPCEWCEPQKCYEASVWWGEVLLVFYTTDPSRLEPNRLNEEACKILQELTKALKPESETVIEPEDLQESMRSTILCCFWADFVPAVAMAYGNKVTIPVDVPNVDHD